MDHSFMKTTQEPGKWKNLASFSPSTKQYKHGEYNGAKPFRKIDTGQKWFYKKSIKGVGKPGDSQLYELEAIAGELYRFILGVARAAKSRVVTDVSNNISIISAKNPAGFKDPSRLLKEYRRHFYWEGVKTPYITPKQIKEISQEDYNQLSSCNKNIYFKQGISLFITTGDKEKDDKKWSEHSEVCWNYISEEKLHYFEKKYINYSNGRAEIFMAMRVLNEGDAALHNLGINNNNEVAKIDYDFTLYPIRKKYGDKRSCRFDTISEYNITDFFLSAKKKFLIKALKIASTCANSW